MATRYSIIRKKFIKEATILLVAVVVMASLGLVLQNYAEDTQSEQRIKENELGTSRAKLADLKREMESGQSQITLFNKYTASHNQDLNLNRENATKWFVSQREKFHLVNLSITIPPFAEVPKDTFGLKSGTMIKSDVKLAFSALTDNSVFAFISDMQRNLPGIVVMQDIKINRAGDLNNAALLELNNHRIPPIVTAELSFTWIGVRPDTGKTVTDAKGNTNAK